MRATVEQNRDLVARLATLSDLRFSSQRLESPDGTVRATARFDLRISHGETLDVPAELARLRKEKERLERDIESKRSAPLGRDVSQHAPRPKSCSQMETTLAERRVELIKVNERLGTAEKISGASAAT